MPHMQLGSTLSPQAQRQALARFVHRFTATHRPAWTNKPMPNGSPYPVQFADDNDWLAHTRFPVKADGTLSEREHYCQSSPTWLHNPELRK